MLGRTSRTRPSRSSSSTKGTHHQQDYKQYSYDIERDGRLIDSGWIVISVNKDGLFRDPKTVLNRIKR
ncbi:hypothetical protein [Spirillospora sp. NPDC048819]|uniref:hypothetical protein n=1 Tax=Spirillospora sp. NPDC048819 TaxID=3155268 RepID=UPI00340C7DEF